MATYNTLIRKRNSSNNDWDIVLPITTADNILVDSAGNSLAGTVIPYGAASGTNTYTASIPSVASLIEGMSLKIKFTNANTASSTLNINGLGAKTLKKSNGNNLASGDIKAGQIVHLVYTGSVFQLLGEGGEYGTAQPEHVLQGYTIGTEQGIVAGTMPNQGAKIITPSTVNKAIPAGYHNGLGYVKGDSNLTPENIRKGVTIFGKTGILQPSLLGANPANVVRIDKTHVFTTVGSSQTIDLITIPSGWQYIVFISDRANGDRESSADVAAQSRFEFDSSYKSQAQVVRARLDLRNTQTNAIFTITRVSGTNRYTGFEAIENFGLFRLSDTQVYFTKMCQRTPYSDGTQYTYIHWQLQDIPAAEMKLQSYAYPPDQGTCTVTNKLKGKLIYG